MRETEPIEPMWEAPSGSEGSRTWSAATRLSTRILRRAMPHVFRWASGQRPGLVVAWGATEYRVARRGLLSRRRVGRGWEDNPRSNYNDAVSKRQDRAGATGPAQAQRDAAAARADLAQAQQKQAETEAKLKKARADTRRIRAEAKKARAEATAAREQAAPALDFSAESLEAEVANTMGLDPDASDPADVPKDPDVVRARLTAMRTLLQALDDVTDFDLVEAVDDDLYKLHKAVEYKLKNHKASEAKAKLDGLFK